MSRVSPRVVIGMDPHKRSVTIEVMDGDEHVLGGGRYGTDAAGYRSMIDSVSVWPDRVWAIEGCNGIGRHVAHRLIADGEHVVDVPPKLSARARVFATGQGLKTDATDAHSVALVGTRMTGLGPVVADEQLEVLRLLVDRRRSLGEEHTRKVAQLHALLLEPIPGGAKVFVSAAQARTLLASVRPRDVVGKTRKRVAMELVADLEKIYTRTKAADKELTELVKATSTRLLDLRGIDPLRCCPTAGRGRRHHPVPEQGALRVLERHRTHRRLLRRPGPTPPIPQGKPTDQRVLHTMARVQLRHATEGRSYYDRKKADGKAPMEAMRCVKRRLSDLVYRTMLDDALSTTRTGPGGQRGNDSESSATGSQPQRRLFGQATPGPATKHSKPPLPKVS